ncbi:hypothetical protein M3Y97_01048800 [Aphelenchoides bicaudatus]|nr:hypothetical protein M3Y97_01048800 [Aphelenchoides bicaudatus]
MNSSRSPFFEIREAIKNNPIRYAEDFVGADDDCVEQYVMNQVQKSNWITVATNERIMISRHDGYCNMIYMPTNFPLKPKALLMREGHPLLSKINKTISEEIVYIQRLYDKYFTYSKPPKCEQTDTESPRALNLVPFYIVFIIFGVGIVIALNALFVEMILKRKLKRKI